MPKTVMHNEHCAAKLIATNLKLRLKCTFVWEIYKAYTFHDLLLRIHG